MNRFLDEKFFTEKKHSLQLLDIWSRLFWRMEEDKLPAIFAQRGYEDKGYGHIERIISNVGELLEKYSDVLCKINGDGSNKKAIQNEFVKKLKSTIILFYAAAHVHDIGMNFSGIYDALKDLVKTGGDNALHVGQIIHDYHHYTSFIILMDLEHLKPLEETEETKNSENEQDTYAGCAFLKKISEIDKDSKFQQLFSLKKNLDAIYREHFVPAKDAGFSIEDSQDFFILLGILCLRHKEVESDYVRDIICCYDSKTRERFNKWWDVFKWADEWSRKQKEMISDTDKEEPRLSDCSRVTLKLEEDLYLDFYLAEAFLLYGDKTEISIARLARRMMVKSEQDTEYYTQLETLLSSEEKNNIEGLKNQLGAEAENNEHSYLPLTRFTVDSSCDNSRQTICSDMVQRVISSFARYRACRFIPVLLVEPQERESPPNNPREKKNQERESPQETPQEEKKSGLDIVIHYLRFKKDDDIFRILRYHNEKDFYELDFLGTIRLHIPMLLNFLLKGDQIIIKENPFFDIAFRKVEHQFSTIAEFLEKEKMKTDNTGTEAKSSFPNEKISNLINQVTSFQDTIKGVIHIKEYIDNNERKVEEKVRFPYSRQNRESVREFSRAILEPEARKKAQGPPKAFFKTADLIVPTSFEILAILNLFRQED